MDDLNYILSLAFSGSDLTRALWLGFIGSLLCSSKIPPFRMWIIVMLIDRTWPFLTMGFSGYGAQEIAAAMGFAIKNLSHDALPLILRAGGLYMMINLGYSARLALHGHKPVLSKPKKGPLPY